jgi:hypothetical protein
LIYDVKVKYNSETTKSIFGISVATSEDKEKTPDIIGGCWLLVRIGRYLFDSVINDIEKLVDIDPRKGINDPVLCVDDVDIKGVRPIEGNKDVPLVMVPVHLEEKTLVGYVTVLCTPPRPKTAGVSTKEIQNGFYTELPFQQG